MSGWQTMRSSRADVSAELRLALVGQENMIVPLTAGLSYRRADPYAVRMAFYVGTDEPVEWTLSRDLLAAALHAARVSGMSRLGRHRHPVTRSPGARWPGRPPGTVS